MRRSSLSGVMSAPAVRLLRAVPRPAGLALAVALGAAGLVGVIPAGPASAASGACTISGGQATCTFTETGSAQTWTVPAGVTSPTFTLYGAEGGGSGDDNGPGGVGAEVTATLTVTPGTVLQVNVGQAGGTGTSSSFGGGGAGGGGFAGGGGGGGASDIRTPASDGTYPPGNRVLVAGGGGGGGGLAFTTDATFIADSGGTGGNAGSPGGAGEPQTILGATMGGGGEGGAGATNGPGDGGASGQMTDSNSCAGTNGPSGNPGVGAVGGNSSAIAGTLGGGGGGGYYGGGSGGAGAFGGTLCPAGAGAGGGGGGSSSPAADVVGDAAAPGQSGNGEVIISYTVPPLKVTTTSLPAATGGHSYTAPALAATGGVTPYSWSVPPGTLPPGLSLNSSTGVISGIPDVAGTYTFTVKVTDAEDPAMTATKALSISVSGPVITALKPDSGPAFGYTGVRIIGTGLACPPGKLSCQVSVSFGGNLAQEIWVTPDEIWVVDPAGTGTVNVTVTVGGVSSQATAAGKFTYESVGFFSFRFVP